jgi:hypothetical protein
MCESTYLPTPSPLPSALNRPKAAKEGFGVSSWMDVGIVHFWLDSCLSEEIRSEAPEFFYEWN